MPHVSTISPPEASPSGVAWRSRLLTSLLAARRDGAWGYRPNTTAGSLAAEPTVWAALALHAVQPDEKAIIADALEWLSDQQQSDGRIGVTEKLDQPAWTTALACLAWNLCGEANADRFGKQSQSALQWLINLRGQEIDPKAAGFAYDTRLIGWPWVAGTNSWLEPTAYAILAMNCGPHSLEASRPRVDEGVRLLLDRAVPSGGWNYGNPQALGNGLRAFTDTTGIALCALAGGLATQAISGAIEFLSAELPRVRAPLSLSWGLMGLRAWNVAPSDTEKWLSAAVTESDEHELTPLYCAMLLLAGTADFSLARGVIS